MAWYAELKRRQWYCIVGLNLRRIYKKKLYDDWWDSLTDEQKQHVEENRIRERELRDKELKECFARLGAMTAICGGLSSNYNWFK